MMTLERLPKAWHIAVQGIDDSLHRGVQIVVWHRGRKVVDDALGEAKPQTAMTGDTINHWMSATKPLVAIAFAQLWERGKVDLHDPVSRVIPEFASQGKHKVTMKHLLTHTACIPHVDFREDVTGRDLIERLSDVPLEVGCTVGEVGAYQPMVTWAILGEVIRRLDGRPLDVYLSEELFTPLGMASWSLGISEERQKEVGERMGWMYELVPAARRSSGNGLRGDKPSAADLVPAEESVSEASLRAIKPASNGRGTARDLAKFYRMLLNGGQWKGQRMLREDTVRQFTSPVRVGMVDRTFRHPMDWGLGLIVNSNRESAKTMPYGFGLHASARAFGHGGRESSVAFADPEHDLVAAVLFNGMPGEGRHQRRMRSFLTAIYEDLN